MRCTDDGKVNDNSNQKLEPIVLAILNNIPWTVSKLMNSRFKNQNFNKLSLFNIII